MRKILIASAVAAMVLAGACSPRRTAAPRPKAPMPAGSPMPDTAAPVSPEANPPGDIPDTQRFVRYASAAGSYSLEVPEGWARSENGASVAFADKFNSVKADVEPASSPRTVDAVRSQDEPKLRASVTAFEEVKVETVPMPGGPSVLLRYRANSGPDPVTGKVIRLDVDRYEIYGNGKLAFVSLSAPAGSDNVDVWKRISTSFRWSR